jgi:hypothetical protein
MFDVCCTNVVVVDVVTEQKEFQGLMAGSDYLLPRVFSNLPYQVRTRTVRGKGIEDVFDFSILVFLISRATTTHQRPTTLSPQHEQARQSTG